MNPYRNLADAVIIQAVEDCRKAEDEDARRALTEIRKSIDEKT